MPPAVRTEPTSEITLMAGAKKKHFRPGTSVRLIAETGDFRCVRRENRVFKNFPVRLLSPARCGRPGAEVKVGTARSYRQTKLPQTGETVYRGRLCGLNLRLAGYKKRRNSSGQQNWTATRDN